MVERKYKKYGKTLEVNIHKPGEWEYQYSAAIIDKKGERIHTILASYWKDIILFARKHHFKLRKSDLEI